MNYLKLILPVCLLLFSNCKNAIKNEDAVIVNEIDSVIPPTAQVEEPIIANDNLIVKEETDIYGFWVGYFNRPVNDSHETDIDVDAGLYWSRENKINISIDKINGDSVFGHSVVAGNNRPFKGTFTKDNLRYAFEVSEPGDHKYDGKFSFNIPVNDTTLSGTWKAYKKIDVPEREYQLQKKIYKYNSAQMLDHVRSYGDWTNNKRTKANPDETEDGSDYYEQFSSATRLIYEINASTTVLSKADVENLKKGDLLIIRNTIYARHGYSFKNRPLRVFFDAQPWYIPVHTDIKSELTEIEKENIQLLLKYEKNASEYYDSFGRG